MGVLALWEGGIGGMQVPLVAAQGFGGELALERDCGFGGVRRVAACQSVSGWLSVIEAGRFGGEFR